MMRPRRSRQLPMRFDSDADVPVISMPANTAQEVVEALADLLLAAAAALDNDADEEQDDAHEDHR
jgi:hypothetical protein